MSWPTTVTLTPTITDDAWGGTLTYLWTQASAGPAAATIVSPTAASTDVLLPEVAGVYVFRLTVTRSDDSLVGSGLWRVTVYTDALIPAEANVGAVEVTANGVPIRAIVGSVQVTESGQRADTCSVDMYGEGLSEGNNIVLTRGTARIFGGVCLTGTTTVDAKGQLFFSYAIIGYAWHLGRKRVTRAYTNLSASAIALDLLAQAPGELTGEYVAPDLPTVDIAYDDVPIDDALTQLARHLPGGGHWRVDYFKRLHFGVTELENDPLAISPHHHACAEFARTRDLSQTFNRLTVTYDRLTVIGITDTPPTVPAVIRVASAAGYDPAGGETVVDGTRLTYTGLEERPVLPVAGVVQVSVSQTPVTIDDDGLPLLSTAGYGVSFVTAVGESRIVTTRSPIALTGTENAWDVALEWVVGPAATVARLTRINLYKVSDEGVGHYFLVGSLLPVQGARFRDQIAAADYPVPPGPAVQYVDQPAADTSAEIGIYLVGCASAPNTIYQTTHAPARVTVNDTDAQAALALLLGGTDDGVIATTVAGGTISDAEARTLADALLAASSGIRTSVSAEVRDDHAHPGQVLSVNFPAPIDCVVDLPIQQARLVNLIPGVPHSYAVTAAADLVTLADVLGIGRVS